MPNGGLTGERVRAWLSTFWPVIVALAVISAQWGITISKLNSLEVTVRDLGKQTQSLESRLSFLEGMHFPDKSKAP
jgi:hypothetical protein